MKRYSILLLSIFFFFAGCHQQTNKYAKAWLIVADAGTEDEFDVQVIDLRETKNKPRFPAECFLKLESDGRYSGYLTAYQQGEWEVKEDKLLLIPAKGKKIQFEIRSYKDDIMELFYKEHKTLYTFKGFLNDFDSEENDPFSAANNKWRIKATRKESDKEINERLKNHFGFMEKYFSWGSGKDVEGVPPGVVQGPLKLYGNGFGMPEYNDQPQLWKDHFYNDEDSKKAHEKLDHLMDVKSVKWRESANEFATFADAYKQMRDWIK